MGVRFCRGDGAPVEVMELAVDQVWENHDGEVVRIVGVGPASPFGYRPPSYIVETTGGSGFRYTVLPNGAAFDANWVGFPGGTLVSPAGEPIPLVKKRASKAWDVDLATLETRLLAALCVQGDGRKFDAEQVEVTPPAAPDLLEAAAKHMRDRAATYDKPEGERSMAQTVATFNTFHGTALTEAQGWHFMQILKDVRLFANGGFHQDSAEDSTAYAALKGEAKAREAQS